MKTYLTDSEFSCAVLDRFYMRMETRSDKASGCDKILLMLFRKFRSDIEGTIQGATYGIDMLKDDGNALDLIGYQFHKAFRQVDPIDAPYLNAIIWECLGDAPVFWGALEKSCKVLTNQDLARDFKEEL